MTTPATKTDSCLIQTHHLACDVLVAGGGPAGVPCALAAARSGAKVILIQDRQVLGGNASSEIKMHIVGANAFGHAERGQALTTEARESGIIEELRLRNCIENPQRAGTMMDLILLDMVKAEPNITLLLNTTVTAASVSNGKITHAIADRQSTEDRFIIQAENFVDCTGDGRLGAEAGAPFLRGRESKSEFNESLAQDARDQKSLGSSIMFTASRHDQPMPFKAPTWVRKFKKDELNFRLYDLPGDEEPSLEYGFWWVEWGGQLNTIKDNELIRDQLLAIVLGIWDYIKNGEEGQPHKQWQKASANWALDWFSFVPGKRESRRFKGKHILTQNDVVASRRFPDAICYAGWPMDLHPPEGVDAPMEKPCTQHVVPNLYDVPLAACVSDTIPNLLFAGRDISATHVAFASTRVMATCAVVGQGVGTAAAYSAKTGIEPSALSTNPAAMRAIQQRLLRDDSYLINQPNLDPHDSAKRATVTASSHQEGAQPSQILSGQNRSVHGPMGAPQGRNNPGLHRWMSDPAKGLPAWLEISWDAPVDIAQVQLTFDTGFHRHMTLSASHGYTKRMVWGRPQPETIKDYTLQALIAGGWQTIASVTDNHFRLARHTLATPIKTTKLRINITATNGLDHARIFEVRTYADPNKIWID
jgi:hypothetical protein